MSGKLIQGENDLATLFPQLVKEWNEKRNGSLKPDEIYAFSGKKVWWRIEVERYGRKHILEWETSVCNRANGYGCPYTSKPPRKLLKGFNDLKTTNPEKASYWNQMKNGDVSPDMVFENTEKKYWWCHTLQANGKIMLHEWEMSPQNMSEKSCPYCHGSRILKGFNDLTTTHPKIASQWDWEENAGLNIYDISAGSNRCAAWICENCGHKWKAIINNRTRGCGCPNCKNRYLTSFPEQAIFFYIRKIFQDSINRDREILDGKEIDIYLPTQNIGIEYNGEWTHSIEERKKADRNKQRLCKEKGIKLISICETKDKFVHDRKNHVIMCVPNQEYSHLQYVMDCLCVELRGLGCLEKKISIDLEKDSERIYAQYTEVLSEKNFAKWFPELLKEWDYDENRSLTPDKVFPFSSQIVSWKHVKEKDGELFEHKWRSSVSKRSKEGKGCPICAGKAVLQGYNDFFSTKSEILNEWDYHKNVEISPQQITSGSHKKVYWKHKVIVKGKEEEHSWKASVGSRMRGNGCPICDGKLIMKGYNDITTTHPDLMIEWDYDKNSILPAEISYGYDKKVWWKHIDMKNGKEFVHSWQASPNSRTNRKSGCPYCANKKVMQGYNDLATYFPELVAKWDMGKNALKRPDEYTWASGKRVWWLDRNKPIKISDRTKYIRKKRSNMFGEI